MGLDDKGLDQPMVRLQVEGGSYPHQRRSRTWLTVRQSELSQAIQRIHRFGGKILEVQPVTQALERSQTPMEDGRISELTSQASSADEREEMRGEPASPNAQLTPPLPPEAPMSPPTQTLTQSVPVEAVKPLSPVYSWFPQGKVDPSRIKPVRRQPIKRPKRDRRQGRKLSLGKQRRQFFRSQPLKRRRRRYR
ncbi:phycobilisome linker polypeptide [Roseofilum sp. BLCC_M154]|uniref:Phycobilisome linker polypeptide n=1 Tax=Roseofilum acuticapitatum BLCC-M154 TaxID=3022444 RepID=A0ABT7ANB5_9CYAN|nr:phycobilisome linker polypeptide [Roseofilum acuticapitatum]MDJ1168380.1 phycobilisome linker polypeptide [Roseofilum acuticapitatum BLCC-M154]